jgi:tetratricopeptide (TPR) repeat protein
MGKDPYGQETIIYELIENVRRKVATGFVPDLVLMTGDIANTGDSAEYQLFATEFVVELAAALGADWQGKLLCVPGNHDVNRAQVSLLDTHSLLRRAPRLFDPTEEGARLRASLLPRFHAYSESDLTDSPRDWLASEVGTFTHIEERGGQTLCATGINTAWLSQNDDDRQRLTPGVALLEAALRRSKQCDYHIVLGHHPLFWFEDKQAQQIRSLFGKHHVIYAHGHMHRTDASQEFGAGNSFVSLQAGAAFQARDEDLWVNRYLWCELDMKSGILRLEPWQWVVRHNEWALDAAAFPEAYRIPGQGVWQLKMTREQQETAAPPRGRQPMSGWHFIDSAFLAERRRKPSVDDVISFFDGRAPRWNLVASETAPKRELVKQIVTHVFESTSTDQPTIGLITGPGGEGKSTILMQVAADVAEAAKGSIKVLWRVGGEERVAASELQSLLSDHAMSRYLLASDDADMIVRDLFEIVKTLPREMSSRIYVLLAARDTDWIAAGGNEYPWHRFAAFRSHRVRGLSIEDASLVVAAWAQYGTRGLGRLGALPLEDAASRLFESASSEADIHEGAFLGGMLRTRYGADLKAHIRDLLDRLRLQTVASRSLLEAFAIIATAHAYQLRFLSKTVLAETLGIPTGEVQRGVLKRLGEEAAVTHSAEYILTRHIAIAEAAVDVLEDVFAMDREQILRDTACAANRAAKRGALVPQLKRWRFLGSQFFKAGQRELATSIAAALLNESPDDTFLRTHLANMYREAGQPETAAELFRNARGIMPGAERAFYFEWGTVEGNLGNQAVSALLDLISLSDEAEKRPPDRDRVKFSLAGYGYAMVALAERYGTPELGAAAGAAADIGLLIKPDYQTANYFRRYLKAAAKFGYRTSTLDKMLEQVRDSARAVWHLREHELPEWVPVPLSLNFVGFAMSARVDRYDRPS